MPRTLNPELHRVRREAFLDVAQRLIQAKGYDAMSVQDVLDQLEASRGAFYHYFDSKEALLDAVIDGFAGDAMARVEPVLEDPSLPALRKLELVFGRIADYKAEQKELVVRVAEVWDSPGNALAREKLRRLSARRLGPILSVVVRQGVAEGTIKTTTPDETARVLIFMMQGYQEVAVDHFRARRAGTISFAEVMRVTRAFTEAFERVLAAAPGSVRLVDEKTMRLWFG